MDFTKGKAALRTLAAKPARRSETENREIAAGLFEEISAARKAGYGFESISKALFNGTGVKVSRNVLKRHYVSLTRSQKSNLANELLEFGRQFEAMAQTGSVTEDGGRFIAGERYQVIHHDANKIRAETGTYEGMADGNHIFIFERGEELKRIPLSPASLKYYTVRPIKNNAALTDGSQKNQKLLQGSSHSRCKV